MRTDELAAKTWDRIEPLQETSRRIHDGADGVSKLQERAIWYVEQLLFGNFPQSLPSAEANILEIGSGLGWIMEAMNEYLCGLDSPPKTITGLDIAPNMLAKARLRLGQRAPFAYQSYDGIHVPFDDCSLDLIYSVACLQHVPRPSVFNLFLEIKRLLKDDGFAVLHFLSTDALERQETFIPWRIEIDNQIYGKEAHWHHYYTSKELTDVLMITGFPYVVVRDDGAGCLVACVSSTPLSLPRNFDRTGYLELNADVKQTQGDPASHYLVFGHKEGRKWFARHKPPP